MPRRTTAATANTQGRPRKRPSAEPVATPVRSSKRAKTNGQLSITQKARQGSKYFEHDLKDGGSATVESRKAESEIGDEASEYEDEDRDSDSAVSSPVTADSDLDQDQSDELSDDNVRSKRRKSKKQQITGSVARIEVPRGQELWRQDVKTGLGPGKQVIIKLPKPRTAGSTPYHPETIHPNTLSFLKDLAMNNDREWLKMHDVDFRTSERDFDSFAGCLTGEIIKYDVTIPELPVKDIKFRIYRDIRFSADNTPYKPYFSAAWSRTGRKGPYAGYYVQAQPGGKSFVGGGMWMLDSEPLRLLRRACDTLPHKIKEILMEPRLRKEFFKNVAADEIKVVAAFVSHNQVNMLKTRPRDYSSDNPNLPLLRLRSFTIGKQLRDEEILGRDGITRIANLVGILTPFITYLNNVVMPDERGPSNTDSSSEPDDGNEGGEEIVSDTDDSEGPV